MIESRKLATFAILSAFTALGFVVFPGHTFLHSDTQIYIPLLEALRDPALFRQELILRGAHLAFTIYDDMARAWAPLFQGDFQAALQAQQLLFRFIGYLGAYLLARSCGLAWMPSLVVSGVTWLGAAIAGPAVLTVEYEPVPRGYAVALMMGAIGMLASGRRRWAAGCAGLAFLYHAPAVWPFMLVALYLAWREKKWEMPAVYAVAGLLLAVLAHLQPGRVPAQPFFSLLDPAHTELQRMRASYNWVSLWPGRYVFMYLIYGAVALGAAWRLREALPSSVRPYFLAVPVIGLLTMPFSWLLLDNWGWALLPQIQPMRALLYCTLFAVLLGGIAGARALESGKRWEAAAWMILPAIAPLRSDWLLWPSPELWKGGLLLALVVAACYWKPLSVVFVCIAPFLYADGFAVRNYQRLETPALQDVARWAKANTDVNAVFLLPDQGRRLEPGIFRARSCRAVYSCWKQGGQVNYFRDYSVEWWERWQATMAKKPADLDYADLRRRGVQYLIFKTDTPKEGLAELYRNGEYRVYRLQ